MKKQLVLGDGDIFRRGVYNPMCTFLECGFELRFVNNGGEGLPTRCHAHQRDNFCRLRDKPVSELFIERDEMAHVHVAVVLPQEDILADLISATVSASAEYLIAKDK